MVLPQPVSPPMTTTWAGVAGARERVTVLCAILLDFRLGKCALPGVLCTARQTARCSTNCALPGPLSSAFPPKSWHPYRPPFGHKRRCERPVRTGLFSIAEMIFPRYWYEGSTCRRFSIFWYALLFCRAASFVLRVMSTAP